MLLRQKVGWIMLFMAPIFAGVAYFCAWQAGCHFDSKQGIGNLQESQSWFLASWSTLTLAWLSLLVVVPLLTRSTAAVFLAALLFFGMTGIPLGILLVAAGEASGIKYCQLDQFVHADAAF